MLEIERVVALVAVNYQEPVCSHCARFGVLIEVFEPRNSVRIVVQPLSLIPITQSRGMEPSSYQVLMWVFPAKIMYGGIAHPSALMPWITVVHTRLPGWISLAFPRLYAPVTTNCEDVTPTMKPVSSKLYVSSSRMPYFSLMERTRQNQLPMAYGSSFKAR